MYSSKVTQFANVSLQGKLPKRKHDANGIYMSQKECYDDEKKHELNMSI